MYVKECNLVLTEAKEKKSTLSVNCSYNAAQDPEVEEQYKRGMAKTQEVGNFSHPLTSMAAGVQNKQ